MNMQKSRISIHKKAVQNLIRPAHLYETGLSTKEISEKSSLDEKKGKITLFEQVDVVN